jgi:hypothetical protein
MIVPLLGSSDQTHLTTYSGDKKEWPVYLSLGNINPIIRSMPPNLATILVAHLPVPPKYHFKGHGKTPAVKEQQIHTREVLRKDFDHIFRSLDALSTLEGLCFVRMVGCGNVILSSVHGRLTTSITFTCIQSSSPFGLCAQH